MPYDVTLAQINANIGGLVRANTYWGFPGNGTSSGVNFSTLLMSYWMCGPTGAGGGSPGIWPEFLPATFFSFDPGMANGITLTNYQLGAAAHFFHGTFPTVASGVRAHLMLSIDTHAQIVQVYINDTPVTVTGTWSGTQPFNFNLGVTADLWQWDTSGVIATGRYPAMGDVWITNPPSFVDLSVAGNRRKFINRDLTPVDLGPAGTSAFGYQPNIYMSIRPGGIATDILTNRGSGGGAWSYDGTVAPTIQAPGSCSLPPPPPVTLALDNVVCTATATLLNENLISLRYSDDRGHSYGSPVTQDIGEAGEYRTSLQWQRLGMARDRVFEISWSVPEKTALQGAWIDVTPAQS